MQASIYYVVNNPVARKGHKVIVRYAGTENYIDKSEVVNKITEDQVKLWRMLGLSDIEIKTIVTFLRK